MTRRKNDLAHAIDAEYRTPMDWVDVLAIVCIVASVCGFGVILFTLR